MKKFGIDVNIKNIPSLDREFIPIYAFNRAYLEKAHVPVSVALERKGGMDVCHTYLRGEGEADEYYLCGLLKTMLWVKGGYKVYVKGSDFAYKCLSSAFRKGGKRDFDVCFMSDIFEQPFEIVKTDKEIMPYSQPVDMGGELGGCRIGFDAGGSDRKVAAVIDGKTVFSEEVVWQPKTIADPDYHYNEIVSALRSAAAHLPRVDGVGVSSAGVFVGNRTMKASLFLSVPKELFDLKVKDIYERAIVDTFGDVPFAVANDGDVSALAGAMAIEDGSVLGIAMGTSEAGGFADENKMIAGLLNELAFVPVDANENAAIDEWSGDRGCGVKYFSQDGAIILAERAGIKLCDGTPAEKLRFIQKLMEEGDASARAVYENIGIWLGHTLPFYHSLYGNRHVLLLGRVMSGKGGDLICETARKVAEEEYGLALDIRLPDEKLRRVGQAQAAASLPKAK